MTIMSTITSTMNLCPLNRVQNYIRSSMLAFQLDTMYMGELLRGKLMFVTIH